MKNNLGYILVLILCLLAAGGIAQLVSDQPRQFTVSQLKDDFTVFRTSFEKKHPNLYLYTPKQRLDSLFDSLYQQINRPMTLGEFYKHITIVSSLIKDGHDYILPPEDTRTYNNKNENFFPLHVTWIDGKLYADMNCTADSTAIKDGAQILSINGMPAGDVMKQLLDRQVRDGYSETYPVWILNNYFREYYSYIFGNPALFTIVYKTSDAGVALTTKIKALAKDSIGYYIHKKYAARLTEKKEGQGVFLETNKTLETAILTIKTFDDDVLRDDYSQNFRSAVYGYFDKIKKDNIHTLVVDLRDNQGGDPENGILLLSWLLDTPFTMIQKGPSSGVHKPVKEPYKGKLYVLVNGGSFSNTAMVSSCLDSFKRAIFVGQETGGNKFILSGDAEDIELPATKIHCQVSTTPYILRADYKTTNNGHGVIPQYITAPDIEDILRGEDRVKEYVMGLIRDEK
jgi:hypothetical protein